MGMLCGKIEIFRMSEIVFWCNGIPCIIIPTIIVHFIVIMWGDCPFRAYFLADLPCFEGQLFFKWGGMLCCYFGIATLT